mmetsp:Transcript_53750/g.125287  ORF Transcript_53750/g.125287 Transcript_53750/m.125287 type:complete len:546 (+) Transcript_53750:58-1695(+)
MSEALRCPLDRASMSSLPSLAGLSERTAQRQLDRVKRGAVLKDELPPFPDRRIPRDVSCIVAFFGCFALLMIIGCRASGRGEETDLQLAATFSESPIRTWTLYRSTQRRLSEEAHEDTESWNILAAVVTISSVVGFFIAMVVLQVLKLSGERGLFHSTMLLPLLKFLTGCMFMAYPWTSFSPDKMFEAVISDGMVRDFARAVYFVTGAGMVLRSMLTCCISLHVRQFAREKMSLQASLMKTVSSVVLANPGMLVIPVCFGFLLYAWIISCVSAFTALLDDHSIDAGVSVLATMILVWWGTGVAAHLTILAFSGVYISWYYSTPGQPVLSSFRSTFGFSFGSACFASFSRPWVRVVELLSRLLQPTGPDCQANPVRACLTCCCACAVNGLFRLTGDISHFFNTWAFTQCILRNASFQHASIITFAFCTCANITLITNNLIIDYVTGCGVRFGGFLGLIIGATAHYFGQWPWLYWAPAAGYICASIMTSIVLSVAKTGFKSILILWAESPGQLEQLEPETHRDILCCIQKRLEEHRPRAVSEMSQRS